MHRRTFLARVVAVIQGAIACVVVIPGLRFLLEPLRRTRKKSTFLRAIPLSALPADQPTLVTLHGDRRDAYVQYPPGPIGSVWLIRKTDESGASKSKPKLRCLQTICPHLGCGIDYAAARKKYTCPCHASDFDLSGQALTGPSPRAMDELLCRITEPDEHGQQWIEVQYERFKTGVAQRETLA